MVPRALLVLLLIACLAGGGSNRADTVSLLLLRPLAVLAAGALVLLGADPREPALRVPWYLLVASGMLAAAQLVPLPPAVWSLLPGHGMFAEAATVADIPQPWRPLSATPDMTWNSLASLLIPAAVLLACSAALTGLSRRSLPWILALGIASALLGIVQLAGGPTSMFYLYPGTADGLPIGFLANRNHQALLLAMMLPLLAAWSRTPDAKGRPSVHRYTAAGVIAVTLLPVILATGSRSGLVLTGLAALGGLALLPWHRFGARRGRLAFIAVAVVLGAIIGITTLTGRALVFARLSHGGDLEAEMRIASAPTILRLVAANLPLGSGLGTFDTAFRAAEPDALLNPNYFNHAHDDFLELLMTGGLPGLAILAAFVAWLARAGWRIWRMADGDRRARGLAGVVCIVLMLLGSISDYPLRVPLMEALLILFSAWVGSTTRTASPQGDGRPDYVRGRTAVAFRQDSL